MIFFLLIFVAGCFLIALALHILRGGLLVTFWGIRTIRNYRAQVKAIKQARADWQPSPVQYVQPEKTNDPRYNSTLDLDAPFNRVAPVTNAYPGYVYSWDPKVKEKK